MRKRPVNIPSQVKLPCQIGSLLIFQPLFTKITLTVFYNIDFGIITDYAGENVFVAMTIFWSDSAVMKAILIYNFNGNKFLIFNRTTVLENRTILSFL